MKRSYKLNTRSLFSLPASVFFILMIFLSAGGTQAQDRRIEISPMAGYMLGGSVKFYEGKFKIQDNFCYGGGLAVEVRQNVLLEINYNRMDTYGDWKPYNSYLVDYPARTIKVAMNHLQIGSMKELSLDKDAVKPYGLFTLGTSWLHSDETNASDTWLFSIGLGLGLKYYFTPRIGIRLQARMMLPMVFSGAGFYLGVGSGGTSGGVGVSSTVPIVQGDFSGGLVIALGK